MNETISQKAIAKREQVSDGELALIKRTVAVGATDDELQMFIYDCKRRGVHPLDKLLHFTKRSGKYTPIVSIDLMRSRAAESGEMAGSDDAVFVESGGKPTSATVTVYRLTNGTRYGYTGTARWSEFYANSAIWNKMPHVMLSKCAEAIALRKAFPHQLEGLYITREEMDQAEETVDSPKPGQMKVVTSGKRDYPTPKQAQETAAEQHQEKPSVTVSAPSTPAEPVGVEADPDVDEPPDPIEEAGRLAAQRGFDALLAFWLTLSPETRRKYESIKDNEWKPAANAVEAAKLN